MIFEWPSDTAYRPISGRFGLTPISQISVSPYSGAIKAVNLAQVWSAEFTLGPKDLATAHDIQAFIEKLEGAANPVRLWDFWNPTPTLLSGNQSGFSDGTLFTDGTGFTDGYAPRVLYAATRGARFIAMQELPASQQCFKRGDRIGVGGGVYQVANPVTSNSLGQALLPVLPGLRSNLAVDDPVTLWRPKLAMRMIPGGDGMPRVFHRADPITLSFVEDVP